MKTILLGAVAVVVVVAVLAVANPFGERGGGSVRPIEDSGATERTDSGMAPAPIDVASTPAPIPSASEPTTGSPTAAEGPALHGIVVDFATGQPIVGATIEVYPARFAVGSVARPRRPANAVTEPRIAGPVARSTSDASGRFSIPWDADHTADLRVSAPGHLDETHSSVSVDDDRKVPLRRGSPIRGRVRRGEGAAIEGAVLRADSIPRDTPTRGIRLSSDARSEGSGSFELLGLEGVTSAIVVTHPDFMTATVRSTPESGPIDVVMAPAFRVWFRVRASEGSAVQAPLVQWTRTGASGASLGVGMVDLSAEARGASNESVGPVKVPCVPSEGTVRFTVRVVGRLPWTSEEIPLPAGGGERTLDATLERDPSVGSITVRIRDPDGRDLPFQAGESTASVRRADGPALTARAIEHAGALVFDGLVAGAYEVSATARRFGAATATALVEGGREVRADILLPAPASLRVRIVAEVRHRVRFELLRDGRAVSAFDDAPYTGAADPDGNLTQFLAGRDGALLRGLGAGRYAVRVLSPDLVAADTDVDVVAGATAEVTIEAKSR